MLTQHNNYAHHYSHAHELAITVGTNKHIRAQARAASHNMASQKKDLDQACSSDQGESSAELLSKTLSTKLSNLNLKQPSLSSVALKGDGKVRPNQLVLSY
jgi:hypothetical protein